MRSHEKFDDSDSNSNNQEQNQIISCKPSLRKRKEKNFNQSSLNMYKFESNDSRDSGEESEQADKVKSIRHNNGHFMDRRPFS